MVYSSKMNSSVAAASRLVVSVGLHARCPVDKNL